MLLKCACEYREKYLGTAIGSIPGVNIARKLFHSIHIDPTRYRPSSEALLKRALKDTEFFTINNLVDIGNWCSLDFLLPICVYDADKIQGKINIRLGESEESYLAHNNREINLKNKFLLADDRGPFGSPITDSQRTGVTDTLTNALIVIFATSSVPDKELYANAEILMQRISEICGGKHISTIIRDWKF